MHSTLKQRLIGAAVLIALAVIFLPMAVQSPGPETGVDDVSLIIPEQPPRAVQTQELALQLPTTTPQPALDPLPDNPDRVVTVDADATARPDALVGNEPLPTPEPSVALPSVTAAEPEAKPEALPPPVAPKPETAKPVTAKPNVAKPAPDLNAASGAYVVNLGTYANLDNAGKLLASLKAAGLAATSEPVTVSGKPAMRLRLGPYARQADAQSARISALAVRSDLPASVVALDGAQTSTKSANDKLDTVARPKIGFAVQVGAFSDKADADGMVVRLKKAGFIGFSEPVKTASGTLYRVRVGPEITRVEAEQLRTNVSNKLKLDGIVVSHP